MVTLHFAVVALNEMQGHVPLRRDDGLGGLQRLVLVLLEQDELHNKAPGVSGFQQAVKALHPRRFKRAVRSVGADQRP